MVDDVLAQGAGQTTALGEDIVDAATDHQHRASKLAVLGSGQGLRKRVLEDRVEIRSQVQQECLVAQQRDRAFEGPPLRGEGRQLVGLAQVLVEYLPNHAVLVAELVDDLAVHGQYRLLDPLEVAGKGGNEVDQVGVAVHHPIVGGGGDLTSGKEMITFALKLPDLQLETFDAGLPVGVGFSRR